MRTTIELDDQLLAQAQDLAEKTKRPLSLVIEDSLRLSIELHRPRGSGQPVRLKTFKGKGLQPGVDLDNNAALPDRMDGADQA